MPTLWPNRLDDLTTDLGPLGVIVLALLVIQLVIAKGHFERFFGRAHGLAVGPPLLKVVERCRAKHVIFTGHSLGGALATLAFADYCVRFPDRSAQLVTFGAPQPGNEEFLRWLQRLPHKRPGVATDFCFIAHWGDPVAHLPPSATFFRAALTNFSLVGALLWAVYCIGWVPYALCYRNELGTEWSHLVSWRASAGMSSTEHTSYCEKATAVAKVDFSSQAVL
jgi:hypothetical protein